MLYNNNSSGKGTKTYEHSLDYFNIFHKEINILASPLASAPIPYPRLRSAASAASAAVPSAVLDWAASDEVQADLDHDMYVAVG